MGIGERLRRIGDPFERHQTSRSRLRQARAGSKSGNLCVDGCLSFKVRFCATSPSAGLALLIGIGGAFAQSGDAHPQDQPGKAPAMRPAGRRRQGQPAQDRRVRRGGPGHQWPGRKPRMRLARPPRGAPDVARRPRHRLPSPRSVRPFRLPRRPCPGGVPLPDPVWRPDRPQGRRTRSTAASMPAGSIRRAQPQAAAAADPGRADDRRQRRPAPRRRPPPAPAASPAPAPQIIARSFRTVHGTIRNFPRFGCTRPENAMAS